MKKTIMPLLGCAALLCGCGGGEKTLAVQEQYRNMAEVIQQYPQVLDNARKAIRSVGCTPVSNPVRGGTDGAQLSFRGLPCPNLGTGGYAFHGPYEYAVAEEMDLVTDILTAIVAAYSAIN